jgi:acyl carrier protein
MVKKAAATDSALTLDIVSDVAALGATFGAVAFDGRGMPRTEAAAKAMDSGTITTAAETAIARLSRKSLATYLAASTTAADGSPQLDSIEVIWLISEFSKPFGHPIIDVSKVDRTQWSTVGALAHLLEAAVQ